MSSSKFKPPKSYQAACQLLAIMPGRSIVLGPSARRTYESHTGQIDADYFEEVCASLEKLVEGSALAEAERAQVLYGLSAEYWGAGQRRRAIGALERAMAIPTHDKLLLQEYSQRLADLKAGHSPVSRFLGDPPPFRGTKALEDMAPTLRSDGNEEQIHAPMLEISWSPYFSPQSPHGAALNDDGVLPLLTELEADLFESDEYPSPQTSSIGQASRFLILREDLVADFRPFFNENATLIELKIPHAEKYWVIDIAETDCLVEERSSCRRGRKGGITIWRGVFDSAKMPRGKIFRPAGSTSLFADPEIAAALKKLAKAREIKGFRLIADVTRR